jgi:uncharacterized membrane protein
LTLNRCADLGYQIISMGGKAVAKQQLVLAFFDSEDAADAAVQSLKMWDKATEDIKLGSVGILVKDENGKIKTQKLGGRAGGKGAKTGVVLGIIAAILSGGMTLVAGVVGGAVLGGVFGSFFKRGLGLSKEDLARIGGELDAGHAAVGALVNEAEVERVSDELLSLGGKPETHPVSDEAIEHAEAAAEAAPEAAPAEEAPAADAPAAA